MVDRSKQVLLYPAGGSRHQGLPGISQRSAADHQALGTHTIYRCRESRSGSKAKGRFVVTGPFWSPLFPVSYLPTSWRRSFMTQVAGPVFQSVRLMSLLSPPLRFPTDEFLAGRAGQEGSRPSPQHSREKPSLLSQCKERERPF